MKKFAAFAAVVLLLVTVSGCRILEFSKQSILESYDNALSSLGRYCLTEDDCLIGTRSFAGDDYTGSYSAQYQGQSGREVVFGGTSIEDRSLRISGRVVVSEGSAELCVRLGTAVVLLETGQDGSFDSEIRLTGGSNYVMLDFENFTGSVEIAVEPM